ncbi:MAG TPA: DUF1559 domain-containing protein [Caulifigura sp.]|nr:DUF1559 domain-containing protein [Caulifigura sp.]
MQRTAVKDREIVGIRPGALRTELIVVFVVIFLLAALLIPAVQRARNAARQSMSRGHLKQWGLAVHNYESTYGRLPPGGWVLPDGTERHGWVTTLLPYLDSSPLYNDLDLNKSWHHPRNQPLCRWSVPYALYPHAGVTTTAEGYGLVQYGVNANLMHRNSSLRFDEVVSGLGNTLLAGEIVGEYRPWGCPWTWRPIESPLNAGPRSYGHVGRDETEFVFADGQLRTINKDIDPVVLQQLASGGLLINADDVALPPIPKVYPSTKIHHPYKPRPKGEGWSPPPEWESAESNE